MKTKLTLALVLSLVLVLFVVGSASAIKLVSYDDTVGDIIHEETESGEGSLICNGNFDDWTDGLPDCWTVHEVAQSGWEEDHLSNVNLADIGDTAVEIPFNDGLGLFVRNIGGSGPHYIWAYNELTNVTHSGYYWVEVNATMWSYYYQMEIAGGILVQEGMIFNSVGFYGIGHVQEGAEGPDPSDVSEWRELYAGSYEKWLPGVLPCANAWEACYAVARYETIWIDADSTPYFWLKAGQKFDTFNVWTVFVFDDILVVEAADADYDGSMHGVSGAVGWDKDELR